MTVPAPAPIAPAPHPAAVTAGPAAHAPAAAMADDMAGLGDTLLDDPDGGSLRDRLIWAMDRTGWVQAKAARLLGMTTRQVSYALRKYNIEIKRF